MSAAAGRGAGRDPGHRRARRAGLAAITAGLCVACLVAGAQAATLVSAIAGASTDSGPSGPRSASQPTPFGSHSATASFGVLSASSSVSFPDAGSDDGLQPRASFTDDFTITAPGATTGSGILTVLVRVDGGPQYEQSASSGAVSQGINTGYLALTRRAGGSGNFFDGTIIYNSGSVPPAAIINTVPAPGLVEVEFNVPFGFSIELGFEVLVRAAGNNTFFPPETGTLSGTTNVTLVWEGITSLRDFNDNELLPQAIIASGSGTDWTVSQGPQPAVPLGTWVAPIAGALLAGIGMGALRRRRVV